MADARHVDLFDAASPLGRACAEVDWAATAVGPPETWPESLRTTFALMTASRFSMWMAWGPELTFFCNDAYRQDTLGRKFPWALGRPASEVWAEIWSDIGPLIDTVVNRGASTWDEGMQLFLERSGFSEETYHTFSYSPLVDDDGRVAGMFCVVSEDTGRVLSQRRIGALRDLAASLSNANTEAEVFAAAELELAKDPYDLPFVAGYLVDRDGDGTTALLAFTSGIPAGHPAAPVLLDLGGKSAWAEHWPHDGGLRLVEDLPGRFAELPTGAWTEPPVQALVAGLSQPGGAGQTGAVAVGMNPHRPIDADYQGFVSLVADQLAAAIVRARTFEAERRRVEQMAELDLAKTTFFTNVSHELRTPLTLLLGPAEDALDDTTEALGGVQRTRVEIIQRNGERLLKLVNTLLDFSRLESGRTQARFEPVELHRLTSELASMFESAFARAGLTFTIDCLPLDVAIYVDREMWAKIVLNLVSNALKATFSGGVTVTLRPTSGGVELCVSDTGVGIAAGEVTRLFERFHRVSSAQLRSHEGSGIGLALVAELVALHGGTVRVDSEVGVGSTFTVDVPAGFAHLPPQDVVAASSGVSSSRLGAGYLAEALRWIDDELEGAEPEEAAADGGTRHRVLVVDDNADMRDYIRDLLADEYAVITAADGGEALTRARIELPDLVLTDVMMPVLDGFGLLRALRADPATQHVPVVMLSARSGNEAAVEGLEAGADDYLIKPFSQRELRARVRSNLELDRVRRVADELSRNREMLAYAEELAQVGSFEFDAGADELRGTAQFFQLFGVEPEGAPSIALLDTVRPADRARLDAAVASCLDTGEDLDLEFSVNAAGRSRTLWLRAVKQAGSDGSKRSLRGSVQDITDRLAAAHVAEAEAVARKAAAREHEIAHELQSSLLPARNFDADHLDIATYYRAGVEGTQVGGDWYDVIELDAGRTALVLGDVMGRGIQAAAIMGQLRATVRAYARLELAPDLLMHLLDDAVRDIRADMIVTCIYAVYEPMDQTLTYCSAGHLPPLLLVPGRSRVASPAAGRPSVPVGRGDVREVIGLPAGSLVALYTDGLVERRGGDIDEGIDRLAELLGSAPADLNATPGYLAQALLPDGQDDDVALLLARVSDRASSDRVFATEVGYDVALVAGVRDAVGAQLTKWDVAPTLIDDVRLVVSELVTNAIVHGRPPLQLRMRKGDGRLFIEVFDSAVTSPQLRHAAPTDDHGRGLLIVSLVAKRWGTRPTPTGKAVWCQLVLT